MKQIQDVSMPTDFTLSGAGRVDNVFANRLLSQLRKRLHRMWADRREILLAAAATCTISLSVLLISYLFFVQLAAHGW
ncbi:MAG: hypothetical protein P8X86_03025 [Desulfofustis sp.]